MLGAIAGDIIGSPYEYDNNRTDFDFPLFGPAVNNNAVRYTDDTVLTIATAYALMNSVPYSQAYEKFARMEPHLDYGARFGQYVFSPEGLRPYNSLGNGAAMRVSPIGWYFDTLEQTLAEAERSAACTHNHPEGVKGAQCTAALIYLARKGANRAALRTYAKERYGYALGDLNAVLSALRDMDETCPGTMPVALAAFFAGDGWEDCIRRAVTAGGDTDTICAITGAIAEAHDGLPDSIRDLALAFLPAGFRTIVDSFEAAWPAS